MANILVNPGSGPIADGDGWTNTVEGARVEAERWLAIITDGQGIRDVALEDDAEELDDGRWRFWYRHTVTGVRVDLITHGIDNLAAYRRAQVFDPRVYWKGSSTSEPQLEDWAADGFEMIRTFRPVTS
jgi:hypothetical protein